MPDHSISGAHGAPPNVPVVHTARVQGAGYSSANYRVYASVADLRLATVAQSDVVLVRGVSQFEWDDDSTATDDGSASPAAVQLTGITTGRYLPVAGSTISVTLPDGTDGVASRIDLPSFEAAISTTGTGAANRVALNSMSAALEAAGGGIITVSRSGTYNFAFDASDDYVAIRGRSNVTLRGVPGVIFCLPAGGGFLLFCGETVHDFAVDSIALDGNDAAGYGIYVHGATSVSLRNGSSKHFGVDGCTVVRNWRASGLVNSSNFRAENWNFDNNTRNGLSVNSCAGLVINRKCSAIGNGLVGIDVELEDNLDLVSGAQIDDVDVIGNAALGIYAVGHSYTVSALADMSVTNSRFAGNGAGTMAVPAVKGDLVLSGAPTIYRAEGNTFTDGVNHALSIRGVSGAIVRRNKMAGSRIVDGNPVQTFGLICYGALKSAVKDNVISGYGAAGIYQEEACEDCDISGNQVSGCGLVTTTQPQFSANILFTATATGVATAKRCAVGGNVVRANGAGTAPLIGLKLVGEDMSTNGNDCHTAGVTDLVDDSVRVRRLSYDSTRAGRITNARPYDHDARVIIDADVGIVSSAGNISAIQSAVGVHTYQITGTPTLDVATWGGTTRSLQFTDTTCLHIYGSGISGFNGDAPEFIFGATFRTPATLVNARLFALSDGSSHRTFDVLQQAAGTIILGAYDGTRNPLLTTSGITAATKYTFAWCCSGGNLYAVTAAGVSAPVANTVLAIAGIVQLSVNAFGDGTGRGAMHLRRCILRLPTPGSNALGEARALYAQMAALA